MFIQLSNYKIIHYFEKNYTNIMSKYKITVRLIPIYNVYTGCITIQ